MVDGLFNWEIFNRVMHKTPRKCCAVIGGRISGESRGQWIPNCMPFKLAA